MNMKYLLITLVVALCVLWLLDNGRQKEAKRVLEVKADSLERSVRSMEFQIQTMQEASEVTRAELTELKRSKDSAIAISNQYYNRYLRERNRPVSKLTDVQIDSALKQLFP